MSLVNDDIFPRINIQKRPVSHYDLIGGDNNRIAFYVSFIINHSQFEYFLTHYKPFVFWTVVQQCFDLQSNKNKYCTITALYCYFSQYFKFHSWDVWWEMTFSYFDVNTINSQRHIQLGPDDSESFLAVCAANQICICIFFCFNIWSYIKKALFFATTQLGNNITGNKLDNKIKNIISEILIDIK